MPCRMQHSALFTAFLYYFPPSSMLLHKLSPSTQVQLGLWEQVCVAPKLPSPPTPPQSENISNTAADSQPALPAALNQPFEPAILDVQDYIDALDGPQKPLLRISIDTPEQPTSTHWVYTTRTVHSTLYKTYTPAP